MLNTFSIEIVKLLRSIIRYTINSLPDIRLSICHISQNCNELIYVGCTRCRIYPCFVFKIRWSLSFQLNITSSLRVSGLHNLMILCLQGKEDHHQLLKECPYANTEVENCL